MNAAARPRRAPRVQHVAGPQHKALAALLRARVAPRVLHAQQRFQRRRQLPAAPWSGGSEGFAHHPGLFPTGPAALPETRPVPSVHKLQQRIEAIPHVADHLLACTTATHGTAHRTWRTPLRQSPKQGFEAAHRTRRTQNRDRRVSRRARSKSSPATAAWMLARSATMCRHPSSAT